VLQSGIDVVSNFFSILHPPLYSVHKFVVKLMNRTDNVSGDINYLSFVLLTSNLPAKNDKNLKQ
jgi:hypothetical protein